MNMLLQKLKATYHRYPLITSLSVLILFGATLTFATPPTSPYTAGETLDPTCAPGDANCTVTILPDQTGNSGKYLTTDGTVTSWATVSGGGITSLNGLTDATQTFDVGTSGTDFGISSSGTTHTFNIPTASGSNRGLLSSSDWTTFNGKVSSPISIGTSGDTLYSSGAGGEQGDTTTGNNTFLGFNSGVDADNAFYSTFVGSNAGASALGANSSTFVGYNAGNGASTASGSAFFGVLAGQNATNAMASVFLGSSAGYQATNADSSIFIGIAAGYNDTVNNNAGTTSSVLIGGYTNTGGYTNSILIGSGSQGSPIANTANNQFMLADTITNVRWSGVEYTLPSAQAGGAGYVLSNDGSGVLSWAVDATGGGGGYAQITEPDAETLYLGDPNGNYNANYISVTQAGGGSIKILGSGQEIATFQMTTSPVVYLGDTSGGFNNTIIGVNDDQQKIYLNAPNLQLNSIDYTLPSAQAGGAGYVLSNDGTGVLSWEASGGGSSPISLGTSGTSLYTPGLSAEEGDTVTGNNIFFGNGTGLGATNAYHSNFFGNSAGTNAINASNSTFIGSAAGYQATNASNSRFIGTTAGYNATNASNSTFIGAGAGYYDSGTFVGSENSANSIFIGTNAGSQIGDFTLDNVTVPGWSILIGDNTSTGGFSNSIALGTNAINTAADQFALADSVTKMKLSGVEYTLPSAQASGAGYVLSNDGSGVLSWEVTSGSLRLYKEGPTNNGYSILPTPTGEEGVSIGIFNSVEWPTVGSVGATGDRSFAIGINPLASGIGSIAISTLGDEFTQRGAATGNGSLVLSTSNAVASGTSSISIGGGTAYSAREINIGAGTPYTPDNTVNWDTDDRLLNIGGAGADVLTILKSGLTGIGYNNFETTAETALLQVNGSILQTGATSCSLSADGDGEIICTPSDQNLKKDITDMSYGLSTLMQLRPVSYSFIDSTYGAGSQIGFIAQELETLIPEVVTQGPKYKSVNYGLVTSVITKAVQELNLTLTAIDTFAFEDTGGFAERLRQFFETSTNGIRTIVSGKIQTKELCLEDVCVTKSQLQQLLNQTQQPSSGGGSNNTPTENPVVSEPDDTPVDTPTESSEEVAETPSEDTPETESQQETQPVPETIPSENPTETPTE